MTIKSCSSNHDYKVFVSVEPNKDKRDNPPSPMLNFVCNVVIKYVSDRTDTNIPTDIKGHDSWCSFDLPYDIFTSDDNFSSYKPRSYISEKLDLMKIPFKLDRLFWKQSGKQYAIPLENPDKIVTLIMDAASAMADGVGASQSKGLVLLVTVEKLVTLPHSEYVRMLKAKQETLFCKVRSKVVKMLQLEEQGQEFPKLEWENVVDVIVKSGLSKAMQNYLALLMKKNS
ncbi:hypothetical protein PTKIN_Ptkin02bG0165600 [Pterospermum kingtungense]